MAESISLENFVGKMEALNSEMRSGKLGHGEYDQRLARLISELRDRK